MATYIVSYRVGTVGDYAERYRSLIEQISKSARYWDETTSFALIESTETTDEFADRLYYKTQLVAMWDHLLVIRLDTGNAVIRGPVEYPNTLKALLPKVVQK